MVAPSGDQAGGPRLGGGTRAPVTTGGDGALQAAGHGGDQVAGGGLDRWCLLVGRGKLVVKLSSSLITFYYSIDL